jgi:RNA polymerase sigma factor (TIGR02999 family)
MSRSADIQESAANGDSQTVAELLPLVYGELQHLAKARLARVRAGEELTPTELVHEAFLRVAGHQTAGFDSRRHFFFAASRAMRDVLVENARRRASLKRGRAVSWTELEGEKLAVQAPPEYLLDLERALAKLELAHPDCSRVFLLSRLGGYTHPEIAELIGRSRATVERRVSRARAWLRRELSSST